MKKFFLTAIATGTSLMMLAACNEEGATATDNQWIYNCDHDSFEDKTTCSLEYDSDSEGLTVRFLARPTMGIGLAAIVYTDTNDYFENAAFKTGTEIHRFNCNDGDYANHRKCPIANLFSTSQLGNLLKGIGGNGGAALRMSTDDNSYYDYKISSYNFQTALAQFIAANKSPQ